MKKSLFVLVCLLAHFFSCMAQQRRPVDSQHPLWLIHVDVWYKADPQKIIDLIPEDIRPYVCLNLSLSCQYDKEKNVYKMPHYAFQTYRSWGTVCQQNGMWFTCQPASGGHTHIQDDDLATFEYFFKYFPNFLGWNYAEQFWGFDESGDKSSSSQTSRWELFAKLVEMSHEYGGFLTVSFCGNIWSHPLNPIGEMKRNSNLLNACRQYPEAILWLYKYTTSSCFYNNESVTFGPFIAGLAKNYGVRYDNCGWNGALSGVLGDGNGKKYPAAAGIGTVMEQTCVNGGAVWDGPELTWNQECFHEINQTTVDGYTRRNWERFPNMNGVWIDMFRKILDGTMYIPTREEVVEKTKIVIINNVNSGNDEQKYATWGDLYDGVYKQNDPFNKGDGRWMNNFCYFKSTGRYGTIPMVVELHDDLAKAIPVQVRKSNYSSRWSTIARKTADFDKQYPEVSKGDLFVNRFRNQFVTYTPYSYLNAKTRASAVIPMQYNTCDSMKLDYDKLSSGIVHEYADRLDFYLNNYRNDTTALRSDTIIIYGVASEPSYQMTRHDTGRGNATAVYNAEAKTYKLTVKHCGAVDITLQCAGTAERDATLPVVGYTALSVPQIPEPYRGEIIIEAEDMDFRSVKNCTTDPYNFYPSVIGHSANGFVDMGTSTSGALRHQITLQSHQAGAYVISVRYTCDSKAGDLTLSVNGSTHTARCDQTGVNEWRYATVETALNEGKNTLLVRNTGRLPMYIDQVIYRPTDVAPSTFNINIREAEHGALTTDVTESPEGEIITLHVQADEGYQLKEVRVVNSVFFSQDKRLDIRTLDAETGTLTFVMPNDNVTLQPVFADGDTTYGFNLDTAGTGTIPDGWICTQENNEEHAYPNSYTQGARVFVGFNGYQGRALYWRNGMAEYGRQEAFPLTLQTGTYKLSYAMAAWKGSPSYKVSIVNATTNQAVATSSTFTASPNVNGSTSGNVSSSQLRTLDFTISEGGKYILRFSDATSGSGLHEFLLLQARITNTTPVAIDQVLADGHPVAIFDVSGRRVATLQRGLNIVRRRDGSTHKVLLK